MYCLECGKQIPDHSKFCWICGAPQPFYKPLDRAPRGDAGSEPEPPAESVQEEEPAEELITDTVPESEEVQVQEPEAAQETEPEKVPEETEAKEEAAEPEPETEEVAEPEAEEEPEPEQEPEEEPEPEQEPEEEPEPEAGEEQVQEPETEEVTDRIPDQTENLSTNQWTDQMPPPKPEQTPEPLPYTPETVTGVHTDSSDALTDHKKKKVPVAAFIAGAVLLAAAAAIIGILNFTGLLRGKETVYYTTRYTTYDASDKKTGWTEYSYDDDHNMTEMVEYDESGKVISKTLNRYDGLGRREGSASYDENNKLSYETSFRYDADGKQVFYEFVYYRDDGTKRRSTTETTYNDSDHSYVEKHYEYTESNVRNLSDVREVKLDDDDQIISAITYDSDSKRSRISHEKYERDDHGNLIKYSSFDDKNNHEEYYSEYTYDYKKDKKGICTGYEFYWYPRDYDWDNYGNETVTYESKAVISSKSEYDKHGNVSKNISYDTDTGKVESYTVYEYDSYKKEKEDKK